MKATKAQLARLQTTYSQLAKRDIGVENNRDARLAWATELCGRSVTSFGDLSIEEAARLIDAAQGQLGVVAPLKTRKSARDAHRAGVDGRHCDTEFVAQPEMVSTEQMEMIGRFYDRLGWTKENFEQWMQSKRGPLKGRQAIRTVADGNRVIFGLKGLLRHRGLWNEKAA